MNLVVKKYGGTSVASIAKISKIAENLIDEYNSNKKLVVVLSAMGDSTDKLVNLSLKISKKMWILLAKVLFARNLFSNSILILTSC